MTKNSTTNNLKSFFLKGSNLAIELSIVAKSSPKDISYYYGSVDSCYLPNAKTFVTPESNFFFSFKNEY